MKSFGIWLSIGLALTLTYNLSCKKNVCYTYKHIPATQTYNIEVHTLMLTFHFSHQQHVTKSYTIFPLFAFSHFFFY